jgi:hypothetical protein
MNFRVRHKIFSYELPAPQKAIFGRPGVAASMNFRDRHFVYYELPAPKRDSALQPSWPMDLFSKLSLTQNYCCINDISCNKMAKTN